MTTKRTIIIGVILCLIITAAVMFFRHNRDNEVKKPSVSSSPSATIQSNLVVTEKTSEDDPDLRVSQTYKAIINNQEIEVPVSASTTSKTTASSSAATGTPGNTASLRQEIDVTPIVRQLVPDWELGVGIGKQRDGDVYIPVSIQRNYETHKGLQVELHVDTKDQKIDGIEIQHKWRF